MSELGLETLIKQESCQEQRSDWVSGVLPEGHWICFMEARGSFLYQLLERPCSVARHALGSRRRVDPL